MTSVRHKNTDGNNASSSSSSSSTSSASASASDLNPRTNVTSVRHKNTDGNNASSSSTSSASASDCRNPGTNVKLPKYVDMTQPIDWGSENSVSSEERDEIPEERPEERHEIPEERPEERHEIPEEIPEERHEKSRHSKKRSVDAMNKDTGRFSDEDDNSDSTNDEDSDSGGEVDNTKKDSVEFKKLKEISEATLQIGAMHEDPTVLEAEDATRRALIARYGQMISISESQKSHTSSSKLSQDSSGLNSLKTKVKKSKGRLAYLYIVIPDERLCGGRFIKLGQTHSPPRLPGRYLTDYGQADIRVQIIPKKRHENDDIYSERVTRLEHELFKRVSIHVLHLKNLVSSFLHVVYRQKNLRRKGIVQNQLRPFTANA